MAELKPTHRYDDIICLARPISKRHAPMSNYDRAAQFAPFAALTGYEEVISEVSRQTVPRIELDEDERQRLDLQLRFLQSRIDERPEVEITCFEPDMYKAGGVYITVRGQVKKIDTHQGCIILLDGQEIPIEEMIRINL